MAENEHAPGADINADTDAVDRYSLDHVGVEALKPRSAPRITWTDANGPHAVTLMDRVTIGSAQGSGVTITDPRVSRIHAELELRADGVWVRDLGSKNGTFVHGVQVSGARVPESGKVRVGSTELAVHTAVVETGVEVWPTERFGPLLGRSLAMRELFARLARVAVSDSPVLVLGETGTGKELVARAIHEASPRALGPFAIVDCAALPETLLEAELFGHARGAFTGAHSARGGIFEDAEGGTVFLDEIGELPLAMQPKLLRVLESRCVRRVGETAQRPVNFRFLAATHRDLRTMVNVGAFREDLYFRLAVLPVTVPPLRQHAEDIPLLLAHFLPPPSSGTISPELVRELLERPWLGNVRELRNFVERARTLGAREALELTRATGNAASIAPPPPEPQLPTIQFDRPFKEVREQWLDRFEREYVRELMQRHRGVVSEAAQAAGLDRTYIYRLIRRHNL